MTKEKDLRDEFGQHAVDCLGDRWAASMKLAIRSRIQGKQRYRTLTTQWGTNGAVMITSARAWRAIFMSNCKRIDEREKHIAKRVTKRA